ncbi:MAG: ABC transporter permease [Chloroflexi bacterium]|nr:ABC transporter permease [Chloroflexota bacterium]MBV9596073.1 ABC transporter permease [Chloroflexota bacterium]
MSRYLIRRLLLLVPTLFGVSLVVFVLVRLLPGDAVTLQLQDAKSTAADEAALRSQLGLDRPLVAQYFDWLGNLLHGDLGHSFRSHQPITSELASRIPVTFELGLLALVIGAIVATIIGVTSAVRQDTWPDYVGRSMAIGLLAIPGFWLATLVVTLPSVWWHWTPPLQYTHFTTDPIKNLSIMIVPAVILGLGLSGGLMRLIRTQMLEVLRQDFIRTATAKGLTENAVIRGHALKNAFIPALTVLGLQVALLVSGTVVLESIFVLPGMGRYLLEAVQNRDYPAIQGLNLLFAAVIIFTNLVVDLMYGWLDPRVRYT